MLAAIYRISKDKEFNLVKSKGKVYQNPLFGLAVYKRGDDEITRWGFVVSNKISSKATIRNKCKRGLREGVRRQLSYVKAGYSCVLLAKKSIATAYTNDIMREVESAVKKADLFKR